jgi:hypothetical protein
VADISVNFHGVRFGFRTRNPKRRPEWMAIRLEHGPFRDFGGTWNLAPLAADGCRIDFELHYDFDRTPMARLARPVFDRIADTLVDRFVARVDEICAPSAPHAAADASHGREAQDAASRATGGAETLQNDEIRPAATAAGAAPAASETPTSAHPSHPDNRSDPS